MSYKRLDFSKLNISDKSSNNGSNITPLNVPAEVLAGKKKMIVSDAKPLEGTTRVKVKISYV